MFVFGQFRTLDGPLHTTGAATAPSSPPPLPRKIDPAETGEVMREQLDDLIAHHKTHIRYIVDCRCESCYRYEQVKAVLLQIFKIGVKR